MQLLLCLNPGQHQGLQRGKVYTQTGQMVCSSCGIVYVSVGTPAVYSYGRCGNCRGLLVGSPKTSEGFYYRRRFVPLNDPDFKDADTGEHLKLPKRILV